MAMTTEEKRKFDEWKKKISRYSRYKEEPDSKLVKKPNFALTILLILIIITILLKVDLKIKVLLILSELIATYLGLSLCFLGPNELAAINKKIALRKLKGDNPIAFKGEGGWQGKYAKPGLNLILRWIFDYKISPIPQIGGDEVGMVITQVGAPLPAGAKTANYENEFSSFENLKSCVNQGLQKGVQRKLLAPGSTVITHPLNIIVTSKMSYGVFMSLTGEQKNIYDAVGYLKPEELGYDPNKFKVQEIPAKKIIEFKKKDIETVDVGNGEKEAREIDNSVKEETFIFGAITIQDGPPLPAGQIACRIGGWTDIEELDGSGGTPEQKLKAALKPYSEKYKKDQGNAWKEHQTFQDIDAFFDIGGTSGPQYAVAMPGKFIFHPLIVDYKPEPMTIVEQGQALLMIAKVGLPSDPTQLDADEKALGLVTPGHVGVWNLALKPGMYPLPSSCFETAIFRTARTTLFWNTKVTSPHKLDAGLNTLDLESKDGYQFEITLKFVFEIPFENVPKVGARYRSIVRLISVMDAVVTDNFSREIQNREGISIIENRFEAINAAKFKIVEELEKTGIEIIGLYIQDVVFPTDLADILKARALAIQQKETYKKQTEAEDERIKMEAKKTTANAQAILSEAKVRAEAADHNKAAREKEGEGEAAYLAKTLATKKEQLGQTGAIVTTTAETLAEGKQKVMPDVLVAGGGEGVMSALAGTLMKKGKEKEEKPVDSKGTADQK